MQAENFFNDTDKEMISQTVAEAEKTTAGEIAVMVVADSDTYPEADLLSGAALGGLMALLITDLFFADSLGVFTLLFIPCALALGWLVPLLPPIKRFFVPRTRLESQVQDRALRAFYEKGLYQTRDHTGVLFFMSLFERKVWVLADKGIYEKISPAEVQSYATAVAAGIKKGQAAPALCGEIKKIGKILSEHFPIKADDTNELPNEVMHE